jgi:hypothetical protein
MVYRISDASAAKFQIEDPAIAHPTVTTGNSDSE